MLRVEVTSQFGRLEHNVTPPSVELTIPDPAIQLRVEPPAVEVEIDHPRVQLDLTGVYNDLGMKRPDVVAQEAATRGREDALAEIAAIAAEGRRLAAVEKSDKGSAIVREAVNEAKPRDTRLQVDVIPKRWVPVDATGGVTIQGGRAQVTIEAPYRPVQVRGQTGQIDIILAEEPSIEITTVPERISLWG